MEHTAVSQVAVARDRPSSNVTVRSTAVEEALEIGGRVYYPHKLAVLGAPSDFQMRLKATQLSSVTVGLLEYSTPVRVKTEPLGDSYQINFPVFGRVKLRYGNDSTVATASTAAIHGPSKATSFEGWFEPAQLCGIKVPMDLLNRELETLLGRAPEKDLAFETHADMNTHRGREWRFAVEILLGALRNAESLTASPLIAVPAVQCTVRGLLLWAPNNYSAELAGPTAAVESAVVRRAVDFIEANAHRPLTVDDVAGDACASLRALQMGFRKHLDSTPMAYLRAVRLRRVRSELLSAGPTARVADIAARWGFPHAGRFASQYTQLFGEAPSQTLRNSMVS
jgi:AraC-like DNA-binding protein